MGKLLTPWIIDIGATQHITYSIFNFSNYHKIPTFTMKMPNDHTTNATISGTVIVSNFITLTNVYYIHSFIVNLIYVTQLISTSNYF